MKRFLHILLALTTLLAVSCSGDDARKKILKVYNWADYIDESLLSEFEEWYYEQTGEEVEVVYQLFDINEIMLAKIERGKEDFDVACPSEYIIERMLKNDLLLPINKDFGSTPNYLGNVAPYIQNVFSQIDGSGKNPNDYAVGYMWGTTGILFNTENVTREEAMSWDLMFDERLEGKILVKDAFRDVYSPMLVYALTVELREAGVLGAEETLPLNDAAAMERGLYDYAKGEATVPTIEGLMYDASDASIAHVEEYLKRMKRLVAGWEADFGKEMMTQNKAWINLMWSGDAVWAIEEAAEVGVSLDYVVPEEGSVVWFDGWVIPKYAKNPRAARYFINYMCAPENAVRNMDATGYVSVVATEEVLRAMDPLLCAMDETEDEAEKLALQAERDALLESDGVDLSYFFKDEAGNPLTFDMGNGYMVHADCVYVDPILYPDQSVIDRCAVMHDSGDRTDKMLEMWSRVKGNSLDTEMLTFIIVVFTAIFAAIAWHHFKKWRKRKLRRLRLKEFTKKMHDKGRHI